MERYKTLFTVLASFIICINSICVAVVIYNSGDTISRMGAFSVIVPILGIIWGILGICSVIWLIMLHNQEY